MELLVYKASAGSGKTFTLAVEYIKLLILNPRAYRQILAVTFTNKATAEMKERILTQLYGIWKEDPASDAYLKRIKEDLAKKPETASLSDRELRQRAGMALQYMLHDYSRFRVETIDSFFPVGHAQPCPRTGTQSQPEHRAEQRRGAERRRRQHD